MPINDMSKAGLALAAMATLASFHSHGVHAGMENQDTGEQCWGEDCSGMDGVSQPSSGPAGYVTLPNVSAHDCNDLEVEKIDRSVRWLQDNLVLVDAKMGRNGLMDWPGNSRKNFAEKIRDELHFHCINHKKKCNRTGMYGIVYPKLADRRVNLCTQNIRDGAADLGIGRQTLYTSVVAHEIAHLVRANFHRGTCWRQYTQPRFSQALGIAVEAARRDIDYDADQWLYSRCGITGEHPSGMEMVDTKNQQTPPVQ